MRGMKITKTKLLDRMIKAGKSGDTYGEKIRRLINDIMYDLAVTGENWIKVYPPERPVKKKTLKDGRVKQKNHWERGIGWIAYDKDGNGTVQTPSELLYTKWVILRQANVFLLANPASYSGLVHLSSIQKIYHIRNGWRSEYYMFAYLERYMKSKYKRRLLRLVKVL
jgi:hypothetical protein